MTISKDTDAQTLTRGEAEALLYREARLIDDLQLDEWLRLFTGDGIYWIPIDDSKPAGRNSSLVHDDSLSREERVYHLLHVPFPAQAPRSRTLHSVSNVETGEDDGQIIVYSNQIVFEMRTGDFRQVGLGELRPLVARVEHRLQPKQGEFKIALKKILLMDRDMPQSNLTFLI